MANPVHNAYVSDWIWSAQHDSWYRSLTVHGHANKYIWHDSYRPTQPGSLPTQQPQRWSTPSPKFGPAKRKAAFKQYILDVAHLSQPGWGGTSIPFTEIPESSRVAYTIGNRYILHPMRWFREPSKWYAEGYCDHHACNDPNCIQNQYKKYKKYKKNGWRDDLRHHEDQDKNGNMRDGDKVGEHCPPTADEDEEDDDDDDGTDELDEEDEEDEENNDNHANTTHQTPSHSATPHHSGYYSAAPQATGVYSATPIYEPYPNTARPASSAPYYASAYASTSQVAAAPAPYPQYQPYHAP